MACMELNLIHDIRIQTHLIQGAVQMMCVIAEDAPIMAGVQDVTYLLNVIQDACSRTTSMLNTALPGNKNAGLFYLDELIEGIIKDVRSIDLGSRYTIKYEGECDPPLWGDRMKVERIISNILTNALLHTPKDTLIHVLLKEEDGSVIVSIQDEGAGLSTLQNSILTAPLPFAPGTEGMHGLRSIRELSEDIGARISVERLPKHGQRITLHLPPRTVWPIALGGE